ncbi:MAG: MFS transporter [Mesorhizobium sp.]|nr:MFS transporter [Mesorhizobium sp.]MBN9245580.1 MFS transporter [Mesorhizobium sp.]
MNSQPDVRGIEGTVDRLAITEPVNRVLVFMIVALALLMMSIDSTIVATILHALQHGLGTTVNWVAWTLTAYSFGFVVMLPISGRLSEQYGRRRVFLGSVAVFTLASLLCGLADNIFVLVVLRALQAAGGAGFTPSATGIIVDHFGDARDRAVSLFGSIFPIGAMIGPIFGGLFVSWWTWRAAFLVNVPIGIIVILLTLRYIPRDPSRRKRASSGIDAPGMLLLSGGLLAGMLAVTHLGGTKTSMWSAGFAVPLAIALVAAWAFFRHIGRASHPFVAPHLIYGPDFGTVNLVNMVFSGVTIGVVALIPLYAANRYGIGALNAGALLIAEGAAAIIMSVVVALVLRRTGHRLPIFSGAVVIAVGTVLLALPPRFGVTPYAWLAASAFVIGAGMGTINPASRNAGLQLAPRQASTLAALRTLSLQIGSIATISITTAILAGSADPGSIQAWVYIVAALLIVAALPVISRVPEHHGSW